VAQSRNTLTAQRVIALLVQAGSIESLNYNPAGTPPYSLTGSRFDLTTGDIQTPGLFADGTGGLSVRGDVTAETFTVLPALPDVRSIVAGPVPVVGSPDFFGFDMVNPAWDPDCAASMALGNGVGANSPSVLLIAKQEVGESAQMGVSAGPGYDIASGQASYGARYAELIAYVDTASSYTEILAGNGMAGTSASVRVTDTGGAICDRWFSPGDPGTAFANPLAGIVWHANTNPVTRRVVGTRVGNMKFIQVEVEVTGAGIGAGANLLTNVPATYRPVGAQIAASIFRQGIGSVTGAVNIFYGTGGNVTTQTAMPAAVYFVHAWGF
jgi:hypothetical protein